MPGTGHLASLLASPHQAPNAPQWVRDLLPTWAWDPVDALLEPWVLVTLSVLSVVLFVLSLVGIPWFVKRIPTDYLLSGQEDLRRPRVHGLRAWAHVLRNVLGWVLLVLGLLMLVLPGQGLITLVVAVTLVDFPGKPRFQRWLITRPVILRTINRLRRHGGREELQVPESTRRAMS